MKLYRLLALVLSLFTLSLSMVYAQGGEQSRNSTPRIPAPNATNIYFRDAGFDQLNGSWTALTTSTGLDVICSLATCPNPNNTTAPHQSGWFARFGGTTDAQTSSISQQVVIPKQGMVVLEFYYWVGFSNGLSNADLVVSVAGIPVETMNLDATMGAYAMKRIDISNFGFGENYEVKFTFTKNSGAYVDLSVDYVQLNYGFTQFKADFESSTPNGWTVKNASGDRRICNTDTVVHSYVQNCAFMFRGNAGEASSLNAIIDVPIRHADVLPFPSATTDPRVISTHSTFAGMFVKTTGAAPNLTLTLTLTLASGDKVTVKQRVSSALASYDWVQTNPAVYPAYDQPVRYNLRVTNKATGGKVYLDDLQLANNIMTFIP